MHLLLTDRLACPRCGPAFGLILLARELRERRVLEGELGCANCRQRYRIERGLADLRVSGGPSEDDPQLSAVDEGEAVKVAALLGIQDGPASVLLHGRMARVAEPLAALLPDVSWLVTHPSVAHWPERPGVERMRVGPALPFFDRSLRGVVLQGESEGLDDLLRLVHSRGRIVVLDPAPGLGASMRAASGFDLVLDEPSALVAARR
ncbi:MAG: hypothetical protein R3E10_07870 [Gemmatimonadota bacterium]